MATTVAVIGLAACGDAPSGPATSLVALETEAALDVGLDLPTLHRLAASLGTDAELDPVDRSRLDHARAVWVDAGTIEAADGTLAADSMRAAAYVLAAPVLVNALDSSRIERALERLDHWDAEARLALGEVRESALIHALGLTSRLAAARSLRQRAGRALAEGDRTAAMRAALEAADRLAETTPAAVAQRLVTRAEHLIEQRREGTANPATTMQLRRADRLVRGAWEAIEKGDHVRAIRRAYYAAQLMDIR